MHVDGDFRCETWMAFSFTGLEVNAIDVQMNTTEYTHLSSSRQIHCGYRDWTGLIVTR